MKEFKDGVHEVAFLSSTMRVDAKPCDCGCKQPKQAGICTEWAHYWKQFGGRERDVGRYGNPHTALVIVRDGKPAAIVDDGSALTREIAVRSKLPLVAADDPKRVVDGRIGTGPLARCEAPPLGQGDIAMTVVVKKREPRVVHTEKVDLAGLDHWKRNSARENGLGICDALGDRSLPYSGGQEHEERLYSEAVARGVSMLKCMFREMPKWRTRTKVNEGLIEFIVDDEGSTR